MTVDAMTQIVQDIQSVCTIILALAIAEAFNQTIKQNQPETEKHATNIASWFDCVHHSRLISLVVFLLLAAPFFQGNQKYLYLQYIAPLHQANPPKSMSAIWLNFDCLVFSVEAGLFFVMSRSLSARRWQQFYATIILLLSVDAVWAVLERVHGAHVPREWIWFDIIAILVLLAFIVLDRRFRNNQSDNELNTYCYWSVSLVAIIGLIFGYFYQLDYLLD